LTQNNVILKHLKLYGCITALTAFEKYGILRLSGRIFDLREKGCNIVTVNREITDRYGTRKTIAEYRLAQNCNG